jgi:ornithine carbamoyltransferase
MKHLLSIDSLAAHEIKDVLDLSMEMKRSRGQHSDTPLRGQTWALVFSKSSTRTRVSFEVGIRELGGAVMFLSASEIQVGRGEPVRDTARVFGRMVHGAVIRTFSQSDVEEFARFSGIPTINALTDQEHPCQILADLFTIREKLGTFEGKTICFVGDGDCNVARSWIAAARKFNFTLRIAAPKKFQPDPQLITSAGNISVTEDPSSAAAGAEVLYTDVWVSMGKEEESSYRIAQLSGYRIDHELLKLAAPGALVMHCLPAYRGKEITAEVLEEHAATIFDQAENRLHAQKAVLALLAREWRR